MPSRPQPLVTRPARHAALVLMLLGAPLLAAATGIPAAFHGSWVKADTSCGSAATLRIEAQALVFSHGKHSQRFAKLDLVPSRTAPGALDVLADLPDGSPFLLHLTPGAAPQVNLSWRPLEDQLPKRYPLHPSGLRRCPG